MEFNYNKLKGKIREVYGNQTDFANALGIGTTTLNSRLKNETFFNQMEIRKIKSLLNIKTNEELMEILFTEK